MVVLRRGLALLALSSLPLGLLAQPALARDPAACRVVNLDFTPAGIPASDKGPAIGPQIVAWIEKPTGEYVETIYITAQTGRYGIGNRPGRFDFNSGPAWPYGRRSTVFPVWSNKHGIKFPLIGFTNADDNNLSHPANESSREAHFCRPLIPSEAEWDAATCSSSIYTDKGVFGAATTGYPPRADVLPAGQDSPSVEQYKTMNRFDAVSQATPRLGTQTQTSWSVPTELPEGDYVLVMEVALEQDFNGIYSAARYPAPAVNWADYGVPYRGQPSVLYKVPFRISNTEETVAQTDTYIGYGDPGPAGPIMKETPPYVPDGNIRPPHDGTIVEDTPGSGAARLLVTSIDGKTFRLRVKARPEPDYVAPGLPGPMLVNVAGSREGAMSFVAPGDDELAGTVKGYDVRYMVGEGPITEANFDAVHEAKFEGDLVASGLEQLLTIKDLLPETQYTVAVRAFDDCRNTSGLTTVTFTTEPRRIGEVDACFVATAAYGSLLANDVEMLRSFRDKLLRRSVLGELFVQTYYTFGPPVAGVVGESDLLRQAARDALSPVVGWVRGLRR